jgi:hypothetical protein
VSTPMNARRSKTVALWLAASSRKDGAGRPAGRTYTKRGGRVDYDFRPKRPCPRRWREIPLLAWLYRSSQGRKIAAAGLRPGVHLANARHR